MAEGNVELQRRAVEAFHARDVEAFIACLDPRVEYHSVMTVPGGAVYHGHGGVRKYFRDFKDAWGDEFRVEPEAFFDLGEHTLMFYSVHGLGQQSGAEVAPQRGRAQRPGRLRGCARADHPLTRNPRSAPGSRVR